MTDIELLKEGEVLEEGTPNDADYDLEEVDDSFLEDHEKLQLLKVIKSEVLANPKYQWANDPMTKSMIMWKYRETINNIIVEDYLKEKEETKKNIFKILD